MQFPETRLRRLRSHPTFRKMMQETWVHANDLIYPLFVTHEKTGKNPVNSMPGVYQLSQSALRDEIREVSSLGIPAVILFGLPSQKDSAGSPAYHSNGVVQQAIKIAKDTAPNLMVITDVCLCAYTDHGHCGVLNHGVIENDESLELLAKQSLSHAQAGADMIAPSDMMDGRVGAIREILDESGYENIPIMSYAAKYASAFYGPFRDAAHSAPQSGDRTTYQMNPANKREAMREIELDITEGADIIMVKPALAYLDIISAASHEFDLPVAAYQVSGEYSMIKAAAQNGWLDEKRMIQETLTSIKRAGADLILTYFAKDFVKGL